MHGMWVRRQTPSSEGGNDSTLIIQEQDGSNGVA